MLPPAAEAVRSVAETATVASAPACGIRQVSPSRAGRPCRQGAAGPDDHEQRQEPQPAGLCLGADEAFAPLLQRLVQPGAVIGRVVAMLVAPEGGGGA